MTVEELFRELELAIHDGFGHAEVFFDTEAKTFDYHMAKVGSAYLEKESFADEPFFSLHEEIKNEKERP